MAEIDEFVGDHPARIREFQSGEDRFVWGRERGSGILWHLEDGAGLTAREYVKSSLTCPVPGCDARLTTVHSESRRDHLRHLTESGGHSAESVFHAQGCAVVEAWLNEKYPRSTATREEYTNDQGERRADVLLTGPTGHRVAFEVQYSPLTPRAWRERHESYRRQGIVDVWLFGHQGSQLKVDRSNRLRPNDTHRAAAESGAAVLFINPIAEPSLVAIAIGKDHYFDALADGIEYRRGPVDVLHVVDDARLAVMSLDEFALDTVHGFTNDLLTRLRKAGEALRAHNEYQRENSAEIRAAAERAREAKEAAWEARQASWEAHRRPIQSRIRELLAGVERWGTSAALAEIQRYFGPDLTYLKERIDLNASPTAAPDQLIHWQCVVYFNLVAGQSKRFGVRDAYGVALRHGLKVDSHNPFKVVARYLYKLEELGLVERWPGPARFPLFVPTRSGAWW